MSELAQEEANSGARARVRCPPEPPADRATVATCGGSAQRLPKRCLVRNRRRGVATGRPCGVVSEFIVGSHFVPYSRSCNGDDQR